MFFGPIEKTKWPPWPLICWDIFDFSEETAERNSTKLDSRQDLNTLYQVCVFRADRKKEDGRPGLWLAETFSTSPLKYRTEFNKTWQEARSQSPLPSLCFSSPEPKAQVSYCQSAPSIVRPSVVVVRPSSVRKLFTFSTFFPEPLDVFWWNLVGMKYSWSFTSVVVFRPDPPRGGSRAGPK